MGMTCIVTSCLFPLGLFLSSGFIGYLPNIREMVADWKGKDNDSDQLFFTKIYIDPVKRVRFIYCFVHSCTLIYLIRYLVLELLIIVMVANIF